MIKKILTFLGMIWTGIFAGCFLLALIVILISEKGYFKENILFGVFLLTLIAIFGGLFAKLYTIWKRIANKKEKKIVNYNVDNTGIRASLEIKKSGIELNQMLSEKVKVVEAERTPISFKDNENDKINNDGDEIKVQGDETYNEPVEIKKQSYDLYLPEAPEERRDFLNSMKESYSMMQAEEDIRILRDSMELMKSTSSLETFFSRYELALQKAITLCQANAAGLKLAVRHDMVDSLVEYKKSMQGIVLNKAYTKELKNIEQLKTVNGKKNRIQKFIQLLEQFEDEFEFTANDVYVYVLTKLGELEQNI